MITEVRLKRFKRFKEETFHLNQNGLTICAGPNNSGKSTLLHALAVWSFGVNVVRQFKGEDAFLKGFKGQGAGLSNDDFTPINIPDLRHLWHNLKSQLPGEGYSMAITVRWADNEDDFGLTMSFSLVQDRLFVKPMNSNLSKSANIPEIVYVPPVAGVDAREEFATPAKRRAMLGRGLAGSVLRNYLLDLEFENREVRKFKKGNKSKLSVTDLKEIRLSDPWERLNQSTRETFGFELRVSPFNPEFHSVIRVDVVPKRLDSSKWVNAGPARDLMVEGAGSQQWLTVVAFALAPNTRVLLLDEPDAHLFTRLKLELVDLLTQISMGGPQILLATHSTEILKRHSRENILSFQKKHPKYLVEEGEKIKLISGLGDDYAPLIENARRSRFILFVENMSDARILESVANSCSFTWPTDIAIHETTEKHSERLRFYRNLLQAIDGLGALSIRDRDDENINQVCEETLLHKNVRTNGYPNFVPRTWLRREIENYALVADALSEECGEQPVKEWWEKQGWAWPQRMDVEQHLLECDVKQSLVTLLSGKSTEDFIKGLKEEHIHQHLRQIAKEICELAATRR